MNLVPHTDVYSNAALVVYEHMITIHREVQVVWRRDFSIYNVLLVINRYCTLVFFFTQAITPMFDSPVSTILSAGSGCALIISRSFSATEVSTRNFFRLINMTLNTILQSLQNRQRICRWEPDGSRT